YAGRSGYGVLLDKGEDIPGLSIRVVRGYLDIAVRLGGGSAKSIGRYILGLDKKDVYCDHINRNPLDNRRSNLRSCTREQNLWNRDVFTGKLSNEFKGVYVCGNGVCANVVREKLLYEVNVARRLTEVLSASIVDRLSERLHGDFGCLNFEDRLDMTLREYIDTVILKDTLVVR